MKNISLFIKQLFCFHNNSSFLRNLENKKSRWRCQDCDEHFQRKGHYAMGTNNEAIKIRQL